MSSTFNEDNEEGLRLGYTTVAAAAVIDVAEVMVLLAVVVVLLAVVVIL